LPGEEEIFASSFLLQIMFISEDLPTLLLPRNAYSGLSAVGHLSTEGLLIKYSASIISIGANIAMPVIMFYIITERYSVQCFDSERSRTTFGTGDDSGAKDQSLIFLLKNEPQP